MTIHRLPSTKFYRVLGILLFFSAWKALSVFLPTYIMPSPEITLFAIMQNWERGLILPNLWDTSRRVLLGFVWGLGLAVTLGIGMGLRKSIDSIADSWILIFLSIPATAWSILTLLWFGLNESAVIFFLGIISIPNLSINTYQGVINIDRDLMQMADAYGITYLTRIRNIVIPSILPYVFAGSRVTMGVCWRISVLAEMLGMTSGVGYELMDNFRNFRMDQVFAWTAVFTVMIIGIDVLILRRIEKRAFRWRPPMRR